MVAGSDSPNSVSLGREHGSNMGHLIGIDLGGSSAKAVSVDLNGVVVGRRNLDFDPAVPRAWAEAARAVYEELKAGLEIGAVGFSAPGLASDDGRCIAFMPGRLEGLEGWDWGQFLEVPGGVPVLNDAHAALMGEVWVGAARGARNAIMLTLGTGVGGAAMVDGRLLRGHIGRAGHMGHSVLDMAGEADCAGTPGSLEALVGNYNIQKRSGGLFETTHDLVKAAAAGDGRAKEIWGRSVEALACGIASFINILDPEVVIVGGGVARAGAMLFEPLERRLRMIEWQPGGHQARLAKAELGEYAGALGAAWNAWRTKSPTP